MTRSLPKSRLPRMLAVVAALACGKSPAIAFAAGAYDHSFALGALVPVRYGVKVQTTPITIIFPGDQDPTGYARFRFRLDVRPCAYFGGAGSSLVDAVRTHTAPSRGPASDCNYAQDIVKGFGDLPIGTSSVTPNVALPDPSVDNPFDPNDPYEFLSVSRYGGDLVRVRIGATELDEGVFNRDDPMGGVRGVFSYRTDYGAAAYPGGSAQLHTFDTCPSPTPQATTCYRSAFRVVAQPQRSAADKRLVVAAVAGPSPQCGARGVYVFGVKVENPETVGSASYRARLARLNAVTGAIVGTSSLSEIQPPLSPGASSDFIPVRAILIPGNHRLMVSAVAQDGADMESAREFTIECAPGTSLGTRRP